MFKTEDEMQESLYNCLKSLQKIKRENSSIFREVNFVWGCPDIVIYKNKYEITTFELKLKNNKKVWEQAVNNLAFNRSWIVLPPNQIKAALKYRDTIYKNSEAHQSIGIASWDGSEFSFVKRAKDFVVTSKLQNSYTSMLMDRIIRGFYLGGERQKGWMKK